MNAFKIKNSAELAQLPMEQKRARIAKALSFAMKAPALLATEFPQQIINKSLPEKMRALRSCADPTQDQLKAVIRREYFPADVAQKWATPDDNPILTTATGLLTEWYQELPSFDMGYLSLFRLIDLRGTNQPSFKINTTSTGVTWSQREPGQSTPVRREFAETEFTIDYLEFTAAVGILDVWLQYNQFYRVEEVANEMIAASYARRAALHYGLFTAQGAGINQAFATDDATTFNNACSAIIQNCKNRGYNLGTNPAFDILTDTTHAGRIMAMLEATRGSLMVAYGTQNQPLVHQVRNIIVSPEISVAETGYYLILPERKLQRGEWLNMQIESQRDITVSATDWHGKEQYNAVVGDANQIRRVLFT